MAGWREQEMVWKRTERPGRGLSDRITWHWDLNDLNGPVNGIHPHGWRLRRI